jgi:hypothetical protein
VAWEENATRAMRGVSVRRARRVEGSNGGTGNVFVFVVEGGKGGVDILFLLCWRGGIREVDGIWFEWMIKSVDKES